MNYSFDWNSIARAWPVLVDGMYTTLLMTVVAMVLGVVIGTLLAIGKTYGGHTLRRVVEAYVNLFRSIPLILTIFWFYFLAPPIARVVTGDPNLSVSAVFSALMAFVLAESAYYCEIVRAGIGSVRRGQMQAALAMGMSRSQALRLVVLPQAFRNMTPSLINQTIALVKDTSLVYVISLNDFLGAATKIAQRDGCLVEMYLFVAVVYLAICSLGVGAVSIFKSRQKVLSY